MQISGKPLVSRNTSRENLSRKKARPAATKKTSMTNGNARTAMSTATSLPPIRSLDHRQRNSVNTRKSPTKKCTANAASPPPLHVTPKNKIKAESITQKALRLLSEPENPSLSGTGVVKVRYSHYNKEFPVQNGVLPWSKVDDEYCISCVFKGNFKRNLFQESGQGRDIIVSESPCERDEDGDYFLGLRAEEQTVTYRLIITEDPIAGVGIDGLRITDGPISRTTEVNKSVQSGNFAVNDITKSLMNMKSTELHSEEAKDLRERRDLEDILYS